MLRGRGMGRKEKGRNKGKNNRQEKQYRRGVGDLNANYSRLSINLLTTALKDLMHSQQTTRFLVHKLL